MMFLCHRYFIVMPFTVLDVIALLLFFTCWSGYTIFSRKKAKNTACLAHCLHQHRIYWMRLLLTRDIRVSDAALMANLERNIAFFASTTLLVLAGVLTLFAQVEQVERVINSIPFAEHVNVLEIQIKLALLALIFVMAFFQFTWSMRQYGFLNVMVGAAPVDETLSNDCLIEVSKQMATVQDQAGHAYNYGLRSYYFSLAVISWFFHPALFCITSLLVVHTLYQREFKSKTLLAIQKSQVLLTNELDDIQ